MFFRLPLDTVAAIRERFAFDRLPGADARMVGLATQVAFTRATGRPLDNVAVVPQTLLRYLGGVFKVQVPAIATLKSIYTRRATAFEHQRWARTHLELRAPESDHFTELAAVLLAQASEVASVDELVTAARHWLFDRQFLLPAERRLRDMAREAFAAVEQAALRAVKKAVPAAQRTTCRRSLFESRGDANRTTVLEWLKAPPGKHSPSTYTETLKKVRFLKDLGVHQWRLEAISMPRQRAYAHAMASRPPSESRRLKDDSLILEVVCYLSIRLQDLTDSALYQHGRRLSDLTRRASARIPAAHAERSVTYRASLVRIRAVIDDASLSAQERLDAIRSVLHGLGDLAPNSDAAITREGLVNDPVRVRSLLTAVSDLDFRGRPDEPALKHLNEFRRLTAAGATELPAEFAVAVDKVWREHIDGVDRKRALAAFGAATALKLQRGLRRGSIWVDHSATFRELDQMLIPPAEWQREKERHLSALGLPADVDAFLAPRLALIEAGLVALGEARQAGDVNIGSDGSLELTRLGALPEDKEPERLRNLIFAEIGDVQLPDLLLEADALTNFSEILLGRKAHDEHELVALYAALLAHGTDLDAKTIAAMIPQVDPAHVSSLMRVLEVAGRLPRANRRIVEFQRRHAITNFWGTSTLGSSDMMSIDATRHLLQARIDPKRRTHAVGLYTHILDTHGIVHNQPGFKNEREAGLAIEGVVQHNLHSEEHKLARLAVDTHGHTYVAASIALTQGFDLCPRLRDVKERMLHLPSTMDMPDTLAGLAVENVSLKPIRAGWDELLRFGASIKAGRVPADVIMRRLGKAATGTIAYKAADRLGRLLLTIFHCDYFSNRAFRREHQTVLNRGESVHQLQRAIYTGKIQPERGRRGEELRAISGSHSLLTNLVIAWNTHHMQRVVDRLRKTRHPIDDAWLARMGPAHFSHINFRGLLRFSIDRYRDALIRRGRPSAPRRSA
jgi:TnpA family transposase